MKPRLRTCIWIFVCLLGCSAPLWSQSRIGGTVTDRENGEPIPGANILVKGSSLGAVSNEQGSFSFETADTFPLTLLISYVGYASREVRVAAPNSSLRILLTAQSILVNEVVIRGQTISEKQQAAPLTVESIGLSALQEIPSENFYDGLGLLKGVDITAASLGFKVINTRGFNSTSPVRSLQLIDGVDNQSPGLNFSLGNFLGAPELDILQVSLVQGASSAFYGPNAFNGVIRMETKNPFLHEGLALRLKGGERGLLEGAGRWATAWKNRKGLPLLALKVNAAYYQARDWRADNYDPVDDSRVPADNPGRYDAVNIYGDQYRPSMDFSSRSNLLNENAGLGTYYRTGYREVDLVDYDTRNFKSNIALHLRTHPGMDVRSPELIGAFNFSFGTTVYQGDNRFSLRDIQFYQARLEYRQRDRFFLRAYTTWEDAGNSYDPYFTALRLQEEAKRDLDWAQDYQRFWIESGFKARMEELGYPRLQIVDGRPFFDLEGALQWLEDYRDTLAIWHQQAEIVANRGKPQQESRDFFQPGTERFQREFDRITSALSNEEERGTRFYDRSQLYHFQGEYRWETDWLDEITLGGSARLYLPDSRGTVFSDSAGSRITNREFGAYAGVAKAFFQDKLTLRFTLRTDKNQNFRQVWTPAFSAVYHPAPDHYLRFSFSSAIRNPTLANQYLYLNVGPAILSGNLQGVDSLISLENLDSILNGTTSELRYFSLDGIQPEKVRTFELGYRTSLFGSLFLDAGYYFNIYDDFLGFIIAAETEFEPGFLIPTDVQVFRYAANSTEVVKSQGFSIGLNYFFARFFQVHGNYSWNKLITRTDDPIVPAFNTPEHKFNLGISGRNIQLGFLKNVGFNLNYKWIEGFLFEGSPQFTGFVPSYGLLDAQINYHFQQLNTTLKVGASNLLNNEAFQVYGGPRVGRLIYASLTFELKN